jgi:hypothetical protein
LLRNWPLLTPLGHSQPFEKRRSKRHHQFVTLSAAKLP